MRRYCILALISVVFILSFSVNAYAGILGDVGTWMDENVPEWIDNHLVKTGAALDVRSGTQYDIAGAVLINDLFVDNLDLDLFYDFDKAFILGLDYTFKESETVDIWAGAGGGFDRTEDEDDPGEALITVQAGVNF